MGNKGGLRAGVDGGVGIDEQDEHQINRRGCLRVDRRQRGWG